MSTHPSLRDGSPQRIINEHIWAASPVGMDLISSPGSSGASYVNLGCVHQTQRPPPMWKSHTQDPPHSHSADGEDSSSATIIVSSGVHLVPQLPIVLISEAARSSEAKQQEHPTDPDQHTGSSAVSQLLAVGDTSSLCYN